MKHTLIIWGYFVDSWTLMYTASCLAFCIGRHRRADIYWQVL